MPPAPCLVPPAAHRLVQILIAIFAYCYYYSYISKPEVTLGDVLSAAIRLNDHDQVRQGTGLY